MLQKFQITTCFKLTSNTRKFHKVYIPAIAIYMRRGNNYNANNGTSLGDHALF